MCEKTETIGEKYGIKTAVKDKVFWFCVIVAALTLAICTKSSFLYPLNDWVDSNCFYTVGKSMAHGKVLYRDIYEQKGPLLYLIHEAAYLISPGTFTGVYLFEVLAAAIFLYCAHRIAKEYCGWASVALLPLLAAVVYSAPSLSHGDSAEEFCLPMLACCLAVSFRALREDREISRGGMFLAGAMGAGVLWIKYTMLGFFVGWFIVPAVMALAHKQWKRFWSMIFWVLAGVAAVSLPILLYFIVHGALGDLWQVYFYDNMFLYANVDISEAQSLWQKAAKVLETVCLSVRYTFGRNPQYAVFTVIGALWVLAKEKWRVKLHILVTFLFTCLTVYGGGRGYVYYGFIFAVFAMPGLIPFCRLLGHVRIGPKAGWICAGVMSLFCLAAAYGLSGNTYLMSYRKEDMPQYQFASIINQKEDATLLNYGFLDGGFYTASGIVPNCRFFCCLNTPLPDIMDTQNQFVEEGLVDFVVTRTNRLKADNYECVAQASMFFDGNIYDYYLYRLREGS